MLRRFHTLTFCGTCLLLALPLCAAAQAGPAPAVFPTGTLRAKIELPRGQAHPDRLDVRFEPAPGEAVGPKRTQEAPKGLIHCPLKGKVWECAVPAGVADLRLRAAAWTPVYLWGVRVETGRTVDLGTLALRPGASVVGRVVTEAGLAAAGSKVRLAPERMGSPGEASILQRLDALASETQTNDRGFFQLQGVPPGTYVVTATGTGLAPARVSPVLVREGLEAEILDPLVLARPVALRIDLSPPVDPYGNPWRIQLLRESNAGGTMGRSGVGLADREGRWSQSGLAPGKYRIWVLGDLDSRWVDQEVELYPGDVPIPIEIPVVEVQGLLSIGDAPLAGTLWLGGRTGSRAVRFDADEEGAFAGFLPEEGLWPVDLVSESEGLRLALEPVEIRRKRGQRVAEVEIQVPDTTLEGEVVDESGDGVPGARIGLTGSRKHSEVTAGKDGRFRVRGLAPPQVFVEAWEGDRSAGPFEVALDEGRKSPGLRLVLRSTLEVRGRVISAAGPIPGAEVVAWPTLGQVPFASDAQAVTGPDGSFRLHVPSQTSSLSLFVFPPGHAFHMTQVAVERGKPLEVPIASTGGTLVLELPRGDGGSPPPSPLLVHGGTFTPALLLWRWISLQRAEPAEPGLLIVPNVETGSYSLCLGAGVELRQGKEPPAGRCTTGFLPPNGELRLSLPQPGSPSP